MTSLIIVVFALTYLGMALGRIPGLKVDRAGIAMIAAVVLVAVGAMPASDSRSAAILPQDRPSLQAQTAQGHLKSFSCSGMTQARRSAMSPPRITNTSAIDNRS